MSEPMNQQATDLYALNNLHTLRSLLQEMILNINLIESGTIGKIISVTNANLYQIAAVEYGDATQWTTIANANNLSDPMVEATLSGSYNHPTRTLTITGFVQSPQTIKINVNNFNYTYHVISSDTLNTICANIALLVPGATSSNNTVIFTLSSVVSSRIVIQRVVNLVIPQQAGTPSGGILSN